MELGNEAHFSVC